MCPRLKGKNFRANTAADSQKPPSRTLFLEASFSAIMPIVDAVNGPIVSVFALVLTIIRSTIRTITDTIAPVLTKLVTVFDAVTRIFASILASVLTHIYSIIDTQVGYTRTRKGQQKRHK